MYGPNTNGGLLVPAFQEMEMYFSYRRYNDFVDERNRDRPGLCGSAVRLIEVDSSIEHQPSFKTKVIRLRTPVTATGSPSTTRGL
jgi:hypothetical protein